MHFKSSEYVAVPPLIILVSQLPQTSDWLLFFFNAFLKIILEKSGK